MTEEQTALARRAVACKAWRWMHGMVAVRVEAPPFLSEGADPAKLVGKEYLVAEVTPDIVRCRGDAFRVGSTDYAPDLTDPATLGCLLALVREAWGDECVCALPVDYGPGGVVWFCRLTAGGRDLARSYLRGWVGEAEALVAALEAAPG